MDADGEFDALVEKLTNEFRFKTTNDLAGWLRTREGSDEAQNVRLYLAVAARIEPDTERQSLKIQQDLRRSRDVISEERSGVDRLGRPRSSRWVDLRPATYVLNRESVVAHIQQLFPVIRELQNVDLSSMEELYTRATVVEAVALHLRRRLPPELSVGSLIESRGLARSSNIEKIDWDAYEAGGLPIIPKEDRVALDLARLLQGALNIIQRVSTGASQRADQARSELKRLDGEYGDLAARRRSVAEETIRRDSDAVAELDRLCDELSRSLDDLHSD